MTQNLNQFRSLSMLHRSLCLVALAIPMATAQAEQVTIKPAGLQIVWDDLKDAFGGFKTFNAEEGVKLALAVRGTEKKIIGFEKKTSKVAVTDGTNDLDAELGMWNKISDDGKVMRAEIKTKKLPAADAVGFNVTGSFDVTLASKTETGTVGPRALKKGDKLEISDQFKFEVSEIGKPKWGKEPLEITLKWSRKVPDLAAIRFFNEAGKLIESSAGGSSRMGFGNKWTVTKSYKLKEKSDIIKIEVDVWVDSETVTVPVNLKLNLAGKVK